MVKIRNCAWESNERQPAAKAVWARGRIVTTHCPKSLITAQSIEWIEIHRWWKLLGNGFVLPLDAKTVDAIELLEIESGMEGKNVE